MDREAIMYSVRHLYAFMMQAELEMIHTDVKREETSLQIQRLELLLELWSVVALYKKKTFSEIIF